MATIKISDLRPVGSELFRDDESFMNELAENEENIIQGGYVLPTPPVRYTTTIDPTTIHLTLPILL